MGTDNHSESLFTTTKKSEDIRHNLGTVHQAWSNERRRRIKTALAVLIPLIVVVAVGIAVFLHFNPEYGPERLSDPPIDEAAYQYQKALAEGKLPPPPPDTDASEEFGNVDAKVKISVAKKYADKALLAILFEAVDAKPSEIYLKLIANKDLTDNEKDFIKGSGSCMLTFNDQNSIQLTMPNGSDRTIYLDGPYDMAFNKDDIMLIIKKLHTEAYGVPKVPVFPELAAQEAILKKIPLPVKKDQQTFESLPAPMTVE
ncbi:MAG: hypothetical protein J6X55_10270 [Victivallales bacterium]|nr:hypothetical protein [Victivallales bacterium]